MRGHRPWGALLLASGLSVLAACATTPAPLEAHGRWADREVHTTVDGPFARYAIERALSGTPRNERWEALLAEWRHQTAGRLPTAQELAAWSRDQSPDAAALLLADALVEQARAQPLAALYREELRRRSLPAQPWVTDTQFLFVPGWLYRSDPTTGADFARMRALLASQGADVALAPIEENATVEHNAQRLADYLRALHARDASRRVVLVSGSKGGPETALALSLLHDEPAAAAVRAWVNVGGLLAGTALADAGTRWPECWLVEWFVLPDRSFDGIRSLAPARSAQRAAALRRPPHVLVVSYVPVPLSGQLSAQARGGYGRLRAHGPNDGLTLLADAIAPGGVAIAEFGADHYLRLPDIDARTLALARAVVRHLDMSRRHAMVRVP